MTLPAGLDALSRPERLQLLRFVTSFAWADLDRHARRSATSSTGSWRGSTSTPRRRARSRAGSRCLRRRTTSTPRPCPTRTARSSSLTVREMMRGGRRRVGRGAGEPRPAGAADALTARRAPASSATGPLQDLPVGEQALAQRLVRRRPAPRRSLVEGQARGGGRGLAQDHEDRLHADRAVGDVAGGEGHRDEEVRGLARAGARSRGRRSGRARAPPPGRRPRSGPRRRRRSAGCCGSPCRRRRGPRSPRRARSPRQWCSVIT